MAKVKILYVMGGVMRRAGAETVIMRYIRELIKMNKFDISILVHGFAKADYDDELMEYGIPIYHMPIRGQHIFTYNKTLHRFFDEHDFDIVHCNMDTACGDFLEIAEQHNIKVRIAHSHSTGYATKNVIKKFHSYLSKHKIPRVATELFACSNLVGDWTYGINKYTLIKNALDLDEYKPNMLLRKKVRNELGISENVTVIGHIGRFVFIKNHIELIKIFNDFHIKKQDSMLLCIGDGEDRKNIEILAGSLNLGKNVLFLGVRDDVERVMQAFDIFILPSLFEGLPLVGIEAQAAGLPCLFADSITEEVCIGDKCKRLPLDNIELWSSELERLIGTSVDYKYNKEQLSANGYDIQVEAKKLAEYYLQAVDKCK